MTNGSSKKVANILLDLGAVLISRNKPFKFTSGVLSPVYVDNRILISHPKERRLVINELVRLINKKYKNVDVIAGTATAGIPHAAWIAEKLDKPMVYVRSAPKEHGRKNQVEGQVKRGQKVVIVEDLISTGSSSIAVAQALKTIGAKVLGVISIYSHGFDEASNNFKKSKMNLHNLTSTQDLAQIAKDRGYLNEEQAETVLEWTKDPKNWPAANGETYKSNGPTYNLEKSWDYNYDHGPTIVGKYPPLPKEKKWKFLGRDLISPLGVAAGPLPNSKWIIPYAKMGFGSLTLKTVRSSAHKCHPFPNMLYIPIKDKKEVLSGKSLVGNLNFPKSLKNMTITNSFGNPYRDPKIWIGEIKKSKKAIGPGQLFGVSVYGTAEENTTINDLAKDYGKTALLAKKAGADFIEANLACPNVKGAENPNLFKDAESVERIVFEIKKSIGKTPLILKVGYFGGYGDILKVLKPIKGKFEGISAINTISRKITDTKGRQALPERDESGVCGFAIKDFGIKTVKNLARARKELKMKFEIIGVGGVLKPEDVNDYLKAGADHVHSATAIMWNPYLAYDFSKFQNSK